MAAKKAEKKAEVKVAGRGKKECPGCKEIIGARTMECDCGFKFEAKAKKAASSSNKDGFAAVKAAVEYITATGGKIEAAESDLDAVASLIFACGGLAEAKAALAQVREIKGLK